MDNITHSLVGAQIGALIGRGDRRSARASIAVSLLAANLPDADLMYSPFICRPFGHILHHRGHTHTIAGIIVCAIAAWLTVLAIEKRSGKPARARTAAAAAFCGAFSHLALDWLNTYGIHPFWPVTNRWFYGDTIFIVEPMLWITLSMGLFYLLFSKIGRAFALLPAVGGAALMIGSGLVPPAISWCFLPPAIAGALLCGRRPGERKAAAWIAAASAVILIFTFCGSQARDILKRQSGDSTFAAFTQPAPADPLCWSFMSMELKGDNVIYRAGYIEPLGAFFDIGCSKYSLNQALYGRPDNIFKIIPAAEIKELQTNCRWQAFRQFARIPGLSDCSDAVCSNDFRFARFGENNFTTIPLQGSCPGQLPPWEHPVVFPWEQQG